MKMREDRLRITNEYVFFWGGWPSQWFKSRFLIRGIEYNCCEQFMMAEKARYFSDMQAASQILAEKDPRRQKQLGRAVSNFDAEKWKSVCLGVVFEGNVAKFEQNTELGCLLESTHPRLLVEASPTDSVWGIGMADDNPLVEDPRNWTGSNWLGQVLTCVREYLRSSKAGHPRIPNPEIARQFALRG